MRIRIPFGLSDESKLSAGCSAFRADRNLATAPSHDLIPAKLDPVVAHAAKNRDATIFQIVRIRCFYSLLLAVAWAIEPQDWALAAERKSSAPVILISIDTLRADRLGCYGFKRPTPNIDTLAKSGTLFSAVSAPVPLTLPSHASLFTSSYPFAHGITDNGERLAPNTISLAGILKAQGYRTAALVGGFVMDRRFGLNQGFDFYDSPFALHRHKGRDPGDIKRLGKDVVDSATRWLEQNDREPFFLFLHLYDLHTPYNLPAGYRTLFRGLSGYEAELAYVDAVLGTFWKVLEQRQLLNKALIVLTSDHGESLGEHGESTHGYFIYQSTMWVPLIFRWPASAQRPPARVNNPASLIDVAPTILEFLGIQSPRKFQGRSLLPQLSNPTGGSSAEIYGESLYGYHHLGVSGLRALRVGRHKYIEAPKPELYDLTADPKEIRNLYKEQQSLALSLRNRLRSSYLQPSRQDSRGPAASRPEDLERLRSLGYLASGRTNSSSTESGPDPKDRILEYEDYGRALALSAGGQIGQSNQLLERLLAKDPDFVDARMSLGLNKQRQDLHDQAAREFRLVLKQNAANATAHFNLAVSYFRLGKLTDAIKELEVTLGIAPHYTRADELLGTIYIQRKEYTLADSHFRRILATDPNDFTALYNLGVSATMQRMWSEAQKHLSRAIEIEPASAEAHNSMGSLYLYQGDFEAAAQAFGQAVRLSPKFAWARYNLGLALVKQGKARGAAAQFREAVALDPNLTAARQALARLEGSTN